MTRVYGYTACSEPRCRRRAVKLGRCPRHEWTPFGGWRKYTLCKIGRHISRTVRADGAWVRSGHCDYCGKYRGA